MASTVGTNNNVTPIKATDGTDVAVDANGYATLLSGATYYYPLSDGKATCISAQIEWDAAAILTITFEDCNFNEISNHSAVAGKWIPSALTASAAGGSAGGAIFNVADLATRRQRLKVVVGGTGGQVRVARHGKD